MSYFLSFFVVDCTIFEVNILHPNRIHALSMLILRD